jgi:hypothetical protein
MRKEEKMPEPLLKNSHEIKTGQKVRVIDKEILESWNELYSEHRAYLIGYVSDIDDQDIEIDVEPDSKFGLYWNIDFSVKW